MTNVRSVAAIPKALLFVVPATLAWSLFACGNAGDGGSSRDGQSPGTVGGGDVTSAGSVSETRFAAAYADAVCGVAEDCCRANGLSYDRDICTTAAKGLAQAFLNQGRAAQLTYDPGKAASCISAARAQARACGEAAEGECEGLFSGNKEPGAVCDDGDECRPSTAGEVRCNHWASGGRSGSLCQIVSRVGAGDACATTSATPPPATVVECDGDQELYCDEARGVCVSQPKAGDGCFLTCARSAHCKAGRCYARAAVGASCESDSWFNAECVEGAHCDVAAKLCRLNRAARQPCETDLQCQSRRCTNGVCASSGNLALSFLCGGRN